MLQLEAPRTRATVGSLAVPPLGSQPAPAGRATGQERRCIGRDRERRLLAELLTERDGGSLLLVGQAGAGTSTLLDAASMIARSLAIRVATVQCLPEESGVDLAAVGQLVRALGDDVDGVRLVLGERPARHVPGDDEERIGAVVEELLQLLRALARRDSLLITIDDAELLDPASVAVLGRLARRLSGSRVTLLLALTPGPSARLPRGTLPELAVGPVDERSAARLLAAVGVDLAPHVRSRIIDEAGGNPLALVELPAALTDGQRRGLLPLPVALPVGDRLRHRLAGSLTDLPPPTRELLLQIALSASRTQADRHGSDVEAMETLGPAEKAQIIAVDGGRVAFCHPLMGSVVVACASAQERRRAHAALADRFGVEPEQRVWHLAQCASGPDADLADQLERSARRLRDRGDPLGALDHLLRSAELSTTPGVRARRWAQAAHLDVEVVGDLRAAERLLDAARLDGAVETSLAAANATASAGLQAEGDGRTAHRLLVGAIEAHLDDPMASTDLVGPAVATLAASCVLLGSGGHWTNLEELVVRLEGVGQWRGPSPSPSLYDPVRATEADLAALDRSLRALPGEPDPSEVVRVAAGGQFLDRLTDHRQDLARVVRRGRNGSAASAVKALHLLAQDAFQTGEWTEADAFCDDGLGLALPRHLRTDARLLMQIKALVAAGRGRSADAEHLADDLTRWSAPRQLAHLGDLSAQVRSLAALGRSDFESSFRECASVSAPGTLRAHTPVALWLLLDLTESAVRTDRLSSATAHVATMVGAGVGRLSRRLEMVVCASAALTEEGEKGLTTFEDALALPGTDRWPFERARVQLLYGERLRRMRATTEARAQLAAARAGFERIGARPWAERASAELRAAGERPSSSGAFELTPQEHEIAMLAATGLSNKEIAARLLLSHRTVGAHLYRIFPKLGITSRAALRDALGTGDRRLGLA